MTRAMQLDRGVEAPGEVSAEARFGRRRSTHICFVAPFAWPVLSPEARIPEAGGAEVQQCALARLLARGGYRVSMICLDYGQPEGAVIDGITVYKAFRPDAGVPVLRFLHPRLTTLWRVLRKVDADVYYCRTAGMLAGVVAEFCRRYGKRSIYAAASDMDFVPDLNEKIRYARDRWLYRRGLARVDAIVAQNERQRASCLATYGREARVIPSCYEPPEGERASPRGELVLWVGMMLSGKRPELAIELAKRMPHRRFVLVGGRSRSEPAVFEQIRTEAAQLPNVELTGFLPLPKVEPWFDQARVLINTSYYEGLPNTFLQAWARGVPTAGTYVDAPVHQPFSELDEGARVIEKFFTDGAHWAEASRRCREYFERTHSGTETLKRYSEVVEELTA